ncbi:alpha/beta fold hydrolase [Candidatus Woesearchaeota archaeon]|nr:alpha/beta fold hydrolase [Candidatus Woesearchaeota archaeon]
MGLFQKIVEQPQHSLTMLERVLCKEFLYALKNIQLVTLSYVNYRNRPPNGACATQEEKRVACHEFNPIRTLHGWGQTSAAQSDLELALQREGFPYVRKGCYNPFSYIDANLEYLDKKVNEDLERTRPASGKVDLIGHSLGGILAKRYSQKHPDKVQRVFQLGAPNHGTFAAVLGYASFVGMVPPLKQVLAKFRVCLDGSSALQMTPHHPFLREINDIRNLPRAVEFYSICTEYDEVMVGVHNTEHCNVGANVNVERDLGVPHVGHLGLIHDPRALHAIARYIKEQVVGKEREEIRHGV